MSANILELETHRKALTGHCYRMLGSAVDADDAVQETMVRAWRAVDRFDGRSSLRTWMYRIATNVCLDALAERTRRARPVDDGPAGTIEAPLITKPRRHWLEPVADAKALPDTADPAELAVLRESIRLAFVAALQHLPPKQRAVLLLVEVLGYSAAEVGETLDLTLAAVNSALQRARTTMASRNVLPPAPPTPEQAQVIDRFVAAFERYDADALAALLRKDVVFSMPPYDLWLHGPEAVHAWLLGRGAGCRGSRILLTNACGSPAFAQYRPRPEGGHVAWALGVLDITGDRIAAWTSFLEVETVFPQFGLPLELPA